MRRSFWQLLALLPLLLAVLSASAEELRVGGTGSSQPIIQILFDEFRKQAPEVALRQLSPPIGSGGALKALAAGRIDLGVIGRPLQPGESPGVGEHFQLADTPFVLATRDGKQAHGFTLEQLTKIYEGRVRNWHDGSPIRLILRPSFESDTRVLRGMSPTMDRAVVAAALRPGMVTGDNDFHTLTLIAATPGSLGPTTLGMLKTTDTRVSVIPINGVTPSLDNLKNGSYPWCKALTVVLPRQPGALAARFAAFLRSPTAARILQAHDYLAGVQ